MASKETVQENIIDHLKDNAEDYIECLEDVVEKGKCKDCEDFKCGLVDRNMCISAKLNDLMFNLKILKRIIS